MGVFPYLHVDLHRCCFVVFELVAAVSAGVFVQPGAGWECVSFDIDLEWIAKDLCGLFYGSTCMDGGRLLRQQYLNSTTACCKPGPCRLTILWAFRLPTAERYTQYRYRHRGLGSVNTSPVYPGPSSDRPRCQRIRQTESLRMFDSSPRRRCIFCSRRRRRRRVRVHRLR